MTPPLNRTAKLLTLLALFATVALATGLLLLASLHPSAYATSQAVRATSTDQVIFPSALRWEQMREVEILDSPRPGSKGSTAADNAAARALWSDEIKRSEIQMPNFIVSILLGQARASNNTLLTFSLLNIMDFERCEPPLNGKNVVDLYSKCLARVHVGSMPSPVMKEFDRFCYLHVDYNEDLPLAKNHTEFAFDARTSTAYFRVIQHGKDVPACHRAIKLEGL